MGKLYDSSVRYFYGMYDSSQALEKMVEALKKNGADQKIVKEVLASKKYDGDKLIDLMAKFKGW